MFLPLRSILIAILMAMSFASTSQAAPAVAAGTNFSLALHDIGVVYAWGNNTFGQLGDGTTVLRSTPIKVANLSNITAIAAGANHAIALKADGSVWAWGNNTYGQLGDNTTLSKQKPIQITTLTGITAIAAGNDFCLALKNDGTVWAWGRNNIGQLGNGTTTNQLKPFQIPNFVNIITAIAAGSYHVLALDNNGKVYTWGDNTYGQLGMNDTTPRYTPTEITALTTLITDAPNTTVTNIYAGYGQSYALYSTHKLADWGLAKAGQLGNENPDQVNSPALLPTLTTVESLSIGRNHVFAKLTDGTYKFWGQNNSSQLGNGKTDNLSIPSTDANIKDFVTLIGGADHSLGIMPSGDVMAWGGNSSSQLGSGSGDSANKIVPTAVKNIGGNGTLNLKAPIDSATDTVPDQFTFTAKKNVGLQSEMRSNEITVTGINSTSNLSITAGEYSINAGEFTNNPGQVISGDRIVVRHTSSAAYNQTTSTIVNIGGVTANFDSTTVPESSNNDGSGGGCTLAKGQQDLSIVLMFVAAALVLLRRRLEGRRHVA